MCRDTLIETLATATLAPAHPGGTAGSGQGDPQPSSSPSAASPIVVTVEVDLPARELCGNGRATKYARSALVAQQRRDAYISGYACARPAGPRPTFPAGTRVRVTAHVRRPAFWSARRLDDGNLWHGLKATLDGLADAGLVANDRQFALGDVTWQRAAPGDHGITLTLTEAM